MRPARHSYESLHQQVGELLAFFVNGSLDGADLELVHQHLERCVSCRGEVEEQRTLQAALRQSQPTEVPNYQPAFGRLLEQVDHRSSGWLGRLRIEVSSWSSSELRLAIPVAAMMLLAAVGVLDRPTAWETLSEPAPAEASTTVLVMFDDEMPAEQISAHLAMVGGELVSGPDAAGVFTVRVGAGDRSTSEQAVEQLRALGGIAFAGVVNEPHG